MEKVSTKKGEMQRLGGSANETNSIFGPLAGLIGTWVGNKGWNLVAVPNQQGSFQLLIAPYTETLTVTPLSTPTPNRGTTIIQEVPTLMYNLHIHDSQTGALLHAENGTWLLLSDCPSEFTICRQASIPHGDSLLALGTSSVTQGKPAIPAISTLPIGAAGENLGYTDPYTFPEFEGTLNKVNPNQTLINDIANQNILSSTNLVVSTANQGGISNIPFITKNANTTSFEATYWIETVKNDLTGNTFQQLQYSQTTIIEFLAQPQNPSQLIQWPHVNINTLVKI